MTCGADVPFARTARLLEMSGGWPVSATTVMNSLRRTGEAIVEEGRSAARDLWRDGVPPEADSAAEVKVVVTYAGKKMARALPVRLGCVGETPGDFWERAVAQMCKRFNLACAGLVRLGTDGETQYVNGLVAMRFPDASGHVDLFHVARAVGR